MKRRNFIRNSGILSMGFAVPDFHPGLQMLNNDDYSEIINFDIASAGIPAKEVLEDQKVWIRRIIDSSPYHVWDVHNKTIEDIKQKTAELTDAMQDEIALCRNSTEGLDTILKGIDFKKGDEIVYSNFDFPFVQGTIEQLQDRYGIRAVKVDLDIVTMQDEVILNEYKHRITENTRLLVLTHVFNWNGRILPVKKLTELAHSNGAEVLIDGAQSFAQLPVSIKEINPEYYISCFHKWFRGSLGTAFIYIRKDLICNIWPLHGFPDQDKYDIRKLERLSTLNFPGFLSLDKQFNTVNEDYINQHSKIRRELTNMIIHGLKANKRLRLMSPDNALRSNGIISLELMRGNPRKLVQSLWENHKLLLKVINYNGLKGIRISLSDDITKQQVTILTRILTDEL